jgi:hypothetical protein
MAVRGIQDDFFHSNSTLRVRGQSRRPSNGLGFESSVKLRDFMMIGVGHDHVSSRSCQLSGSVCQPFLVFPREESLIVVDKAVVAVPRNIRRIEIHKIATLHVHQRCVEIAGSHHHARFLKGLGACPEILEVRNKIRPRHAVRNIETPFGVDAVESIPAGLVEIQKLCCSFQLSPTR